VTEPDPGESMEAAGRPEAETAAGRVTGEDSAPGGDLSRLLAAEAELDATLAEARREAERRVEAARERAATLRREASAELERERVQSTENFLAVYDPALDTGHVYATAGDQPGVAPAAGGRYEMAGEAYPAGELPLERLVSVEGFFFAWHAFYPESETPSS